VRGVPCPGCGRRVPEGIATCRSCGTATGNSLAPLVVGRPTALSPASRPLTSTGVTPAVRRRPLVLVLAGVAVMAGLNLVPGAENPTAVAPPAAAAVVADIPHPPAAGVVARAEEAASRPGGVWPPPGPLRDRQEYTTVWTGAHMMMWRGPQTGRPLDGSAYDSASRGWRSASPAPIESRSHPAAIWDGHEVLVWGGLSATGIPFADGAAYDPATDQWRPMAPSPLNARVALVAAWTGREVLVAGSRPGSGRARWSTGGTDAAAYDPIADSWRRLPTMPVSLAEGVAAWTGSELIVYGGLATPPGGIDPAGGSRRARGVAYDPVRDRWRLLPLAPLTSPFLTAAWTGREFVAWDDARRAASFDPRSGHWSAVGGLASHDTPR
jgi:hypothetical protein